MSLQVLTSVREFRAACDQVRASGKTIALVPTLGALHQAHYQLMKTGLKAADVLAVSVFVNPTQFGPDEDFERYPRDLEADVAMCAAQGASLVFAPSVREVYPAGARTTVEVASLADGLCGRGRPGHFAGVATVVAKLLIATGPCCAVFGQKDFQQLQVIHRLVRDLLLPVTVVEEPIVREADGLAQSSRNRYLSQAERRQALAIPRALEAAAVLFQQGESKPAALIQRAEQELRAAQLNPEYLELVNLRTLEPETSCVVSGEFGLFIAAQVGSTRLIDNHLFGRGAGEKN